MNDYKNFNNNDNNNDEFFKFTHNFVNFNTLQLVFSIIWNKWADSDNHNAADIFSLIEINQAYKASETNFLSDKAFILLKKFLISKTTLNFYQVLFKIL